MPRTSTHWMGLNTTPSCDSWSLELTGVRDVPWMAPPLSAPGLRKAPEATLDPEPTATCWFGPFHPSYEMQGPF